MNYLSANLLTKSYGIRTLFRDVNFHVNEGDRIALVAKNGSGKTTLLKILAGKETPDSGETILNKDVKVLLFEQQDDFDENLSAEDVIFNHSNSVLEIIHQYENLMKTKPADLMLMDLISKMDQTDAWSVELKIQEILSRLKVDFLKQKIKNLSGGQTKRITLSRFLFYVSLE